MPPRRAAFYAFGSWVHPEFTRTKRARSIYCTLPHSLPPTCNEYRV